MLACCWLLYHWVGNYGWFLGYTSLGLVQRYVNWTLIQDRKWCMAGRVESVKVSNSMFGWPTLQVRIEYFNYRFSQYLLLKLAYLLWNSIFFSFSFTLPSNLIMERKESVTHVLFFFFFLLDGLVSLKINS